MLDGLYSSSAASPHQCDGEFAPVLVLLAAILLAAILLAAVLLAAILLTTVLLTAVLIAAVLHYRNLLSRPSCLLIPEGPSLFPLSLQPLFRLIER